MTAQSLSIGMRREAGVIFVISGQAVMTSINVPQA